jgi:hypothetical protein
MIEIECPGCGRLFRVESNVEIAIDFDRRADNNYAVYAIAKSDAPLSTVWTRIEDVEIAQDRTEYSGPLVAIGLGESRIEDPGVLGERISLIHPCIDETAIRLLEALMECPKCSTAFSTEYTGEGLVTEAPLEVEWESLYDGRMRAWSVGIQILPYDAPMPRLPLRMCVHECEPDWRDGFR